MGSTGRRNGAAKRCFLSERRSERANFCCSLVKTAIGPSDAGASGARGRAAAAEEGTGVWSSEGDMVGAPEARGVGPLWKAVGSKP